MKSIGELNETSETLHASKQQNFKLYIFIKTR